MTSFGGVVVDVELVGGVARVFGDVALVTVGEPAGEGVDEDRCSDICSAKLQ